MANILYNKSGDPLMVYSKSYQANTTGTPTEKLKNTAQPKNPLEDFTAGKSFVYVIRDSWGNGEYYSSPIWWAAYLAGWVDIAKTSQKGHRQLHGRYRGEPLWHRRGRQTDWFDRQNLIVAIQCLEQPNRQVSKVHKNENVQSDGDEKPFETLWRNPQI